jgi:hypothetical protein
MAEAESSPVQTTALPASVSERTDNSLYQVKTHQTSTFFVLFFPAMSHGVG